MGKGRDVGTVYKSTSMHPQEGEWLTDLNEQSKPNKGQFTVTIVQYLNNIHVFTDTENGFPMNPNSFAQFFNFGRAYQVSGIWN